MIIFLFSLNPMMRQVSHLNHEFSVIYDPHSQSQNEIRPIQPQTKASSPPSLRPRPRPLTFPEFHSTHITTSCNISDIRTFQLLGSSSQHLDRSFSSDITAPAPSRTQNGPIAFP
ncbi:hypothetical protein XENORESO_018062 [Xenotaenia resolanae]|uniref:Uncharacterized protein n=1 Tax=Xenotaenia resolanae TaxID=208358 RepID=A0ABV0WL71_9TELE